MKRFAGAALALSTLTCGCAGTRDTGGADDPLQPLSLYFAPAEYQAPLLSPDGRHISYIGRHQGAYNIFVAPVDDIAAARPLTNETGRGIQWFSVSGAVTYRWTPDGRYLIYGLDNNGDENNRLYAVSVETGQTRLLTPGERIRARLLQVSTSGPQRILAAVDHRFLHGSMSLLYGYDIVEIDLDTGETRMVMENLSYASAIADHDLRVRVVGALTEELSMEFMRVTEAGELAPFYSVGADDLSGLSAGAETDSIRVSADNRWLTLLDVVGRDTVAVAALDLETGAKHIIGADERVDIRNVLFDPATLTVDAYGRLWTELEWRAVNPEIADDLQFLERAHNGDLQIASRSQDGRIWLVTYQASEEPTTYYLYDSQHRTLRSLFATTPALVGLPLVRMHAYAIQARDGLDLVGYYTLPFRNDPDQDGRAVHPAPMVVLVHGGPSDERAQQGYAPFVQWLANRGYGVLYVNFRGSAGFGKDYLNAQRMEWGGAMHNDVLDQVNWAVEQGVADPARVAIMGGSYGGYETLVAMTRSPDVFACGVDLVGPSDLTVPMPHWSAEWMAQTIGDPRTPEGQALLRSRSPAYMAENARNPILIGQGDQDSRVPTDQSDRMVAAMQRAGATVVYLRYPDEGHGLLRPENNASFWAVAEVFLGRCLGGRYEPLSAAVLRGSSLIAVDSSNFVPGLNEALAEARRGAN